MSTFQRSVPQDRIENEVDLVPKDQWPDEDLRDLWIFTGDQPPYDVVVEDADAKDEIRAGQVNDELKRRWAMTVQIVLGPHTRNLQLLDEQTSNIFRYLQVIGLRLADDPGYVPSYTLVSRSGGQTVEDVLNQNQVERLAETIWVYQDAVVQAASDLTQLSPIPDDFADDVHWPSTVLTVM